jgi:3-oxoacyl-[acyl-carrier-protein] synthase-1
MVSPSGEGAKRCMSEALEAYGSAVDYINAHGTSTPVGDLAELSAIKTVFGKNAPVIGSTKSMTGHSLGATGAQEAIYSILMMQHDFIAPSINIETLVEEAEGLNICQSMMKQKLNSVMSNSFGFGGTNASLIFSK